MRTAMGKIDTQIDKAAVATDDPLIDNIRTLRAENARLAAENARLISENMRLNSMGTMLQVDAVNAALMLDKERTERGYYHRFAIEVATSLNLVGQIVDEVMRKAQQKAMAERPPARRGVPDLDQRLYEPAPERPAPASEFAPRQDEDAVSVPLDALPPIEIPAFLKTQRSQ